ncbi:MAG: substrate-binding domain-containing protein [Acidobacteria bacterium]|nr:substrate-binding domain-containing protein [Acidobacteriota bacterium]
MIPKSTNHLFWQSIHAGAVAAGRDFKVEILWNGPAVEGDYSRQIQIFESMLARHVDGIAVSASDRTALTASLDRAAAANIPVTVYDSGLNSTNYMTYIATNNDEAGRIAARKMAELIGGKGDVGLVLHMPGSLSTGDREVAFEDVIAKEYPGIHIVARQYGMSDRLRSMAAAENILTAHPDLKGLFCSSEPSTLGTAQALKERNLSGKVKFIGFDSSEGMIADLRGGTLDAIVVQDPFKIGYEAVRTLVDKRNGKTPPRQIDLHARVVTKADLNLPDVKLLLFRDLGKYLN